MDNSNKSKAGQIFSGVLWSYGERFLAQLVTLVVSIVLARILSPNHYGIIAIVTVFITICDALVTGGFGNALVQKKNATKLDFDSICWFSLGIAAVLYIILFISAPMISLVYEVDILVPVTRILGIKVLFSAFNSVQQAYVQRKMLFKKFFFATLGGTISSAIVGIVLALNGAGVWALVAQYLTNSIIDTVILFVSIDWKPSLHVSRKSIVELWGFGSKLLASTMVFTFKDNIRSLLIGKVFSSSDLAYYNQGKKYPALLVTDIVESLGKVLFPVFSEKQTDIIELKLMMRKSVRLSSYVLTPCIIGLIAVADTFVSVILTDKWLPCVPYMRILALVYLTRPLSTVFQRALLAIGKSSINLFQELVTSITTLFLVIIATFGFQSIELIAWSYVLVMVLGVIIFAYFTKKYIGYKYREMMSDFVQSLIMSIVMGIVVVIIGQIQVANFLKLLLQIMGGIVIYIVISILNKCESYLIIKKFRSRKMGR